MSLSNNIQPLFPPKLYPHAPIKEAIIDIRASLPPQVSLLTLETIHAEIREEFPTARKRINVQGEWTAGSEIGASARQQHIGFAFSSVDGLHIFQARLDGFTFSRLSPYVSWDQLRGTAERLWQIYKSFARPTSIERVAVRNINQLDLPGPSLDFDDYFLTIPKIGAGLTQGLSHFLMQLQLPQPDLDGMAVLTQTMAPPPNPQTCSVILDIDVFVQRTMDESSAWALLNALRVRKDDLFEGSITNLTRELFS